MIAYALKAWLPATAAVTAVLAVAASYCMAAGPSFVLWHEAEDFASARKDVEKQVDPRPPASGGKLLYSQTLNKPGSQVTFDLDLPQDVANAKVVLRYARLHWRESMVPAILEVDVTGGGQSVKREISFGNTGGWGRKATDYGFAMGDIGPLKKGPTKVTLSLIKDGDLNLDGFFLAESEVELKAEELSRLVRLEVTSDGYCGLLSSSTLMRQGGDNTMAVAVRSFNQAVGDVSVTLKVGDKTIDLKPAAEQPKSEDDKSVVRLFVLPQVDDGQYQMTISSTMPQCTITGDVILAGQLLATLNDEIGGIETFTKELAESKDPKAASCLADMQHMVEYLKAGHEKLTESAASTAGAWKAGLAEHEGLTEAEPVDALRHALDQARETVRRLKAGEDPYQGRTGDLRRAYRSAGDKELVPYRVFLPDNYWTSDKVPFVYMLHGGGGNENYWPEMDGGKILKILNEAGYVAVMPKWHARNRPPGDVKQLLDLALAEYLKIDRDRVYLTGISMGGFGTYTLATEHPEYFAAICCVSGTGNPDKAEALKNVPTMILQGGDDTVVPVDGAKKVEAKMKELGQTVELHVFDEHGHAYYPDKYLPMTLKFFGRFKRAAQGK
ncbi:MAG: prolyl oligopeptidase family serine peptidase [Planctomycetes bacterium]|nr:prolyl oligopeptidase family serine peptidase [Planctomycetota bacterium]